MPATLSPPFFEVPPEQRLEYLKTAFTLFDEDAIGAVDLSQLLAFLKAAEIEMNRRQTLSIMRELGLSADGVLDFPRFQKFLEIASRSSETASQFKATQRISATKKKIINIYVVVLFFLTFALCVIYISAESKSRVVLVGMIFLAVLLVVSVAYVIVLPLIALKLRRRAAQVTSTSRGASVQPSSRPSLVSGQPTAGDERLVVFHVNSDAQDLEAQEDTYSVDSAMIDEPSMFNKTRLPAEQSYRKPQLPPAELFNAIEDQPAIVADPDSERRRSAEDALALVLVPEASGSPGVTRSSFNPLRATRR